jgi:type II secretory pathway component GspD/PulD (secretin)
MLLLRAFALVGLVYVAGGCAGGKARAGELVTVAELRARQGHRTDSLPGLAPIVRPVAASDSGAAGPQTVQGSAPERAGPSNASPPEPIAPARRLPRPRWIDVQDPDPQVIPFVLFEDPIVDVMRSLSEAVRINIVLDQDSVVRNMRLTAEIHDLPWPLALEAVLEAHRLRPVQLESGVIKIVTEQSARQDQVAEDVSLRFLTARDLRAAIEDVLRAGADSVSGRVQYVGDPETTRRLVVHGSPEKISQVRSLIARLDRRPATISVETRITNVDRTRMRRVGIMYALGRSPVDSSGTRSPVMDVRSTTPGGLQSTYGPALRLVSDLGGLGRVDLNVFIDAVLGNGFAETQTTPFITTTSEHPAEVRIGDAIVLPNNQPIFAGGGYVVPGGQQPQTGQPGGGSPSSPGGYGDQAGGLQPSSGIYPDYGSQVGGFTRFETGTTLRVTPYALGEGLIRVRIELERDGGQLAADGRSITGGNQTAFTDVIVRDGSPIVIAGLTVNARSRARSGVPLLSDLPLLGSVFRTDEDAEHFQDLIIILTPRIESDESSTEN